MGPRLERDWMYEECLGPRFVGRAGRLALMPRGHAEQVADPHRLEVVARRRGASSGKNFNTSSSKWSFPSEMASPTAVDVKLLLSEYREWGASAWYGDHQPSATTRPWRRSMKLFIESMFLSAASTNESSADEETPCVSGLALSSSAARQIELLKASSAITDKLFMLLPSTGKGNSRSSPVRA